MKTMRQRVRAAAITTIFIFGAAMTATAQSIMGFGSLPGGASCSYGTAVINGGSVATGRVGVYGCGSPYRAFRWTFAGGLENLGVLPGKTSSIAYGINGDGSVVVGYSADEQFGAGTWRAFIWTSAGGMENLGTFDSTSPGQFVAYGVSADGATVAGTGSSQLLGYRAFKWTRTGGMQPLGELYLYGGSHGYAISGDGQVVVGAAFTSGGAERHAVRWDGTIHDLGTLPGGDYAEAVATNTDGTVVVGRSSSAGVGGFSAFRWTSSGGMQSLGSLGGSSGAYGVNGDGSVVVGYNAGHAFLWTTTTGMVDLNTYLPSIGVDLTGWPNLHAANGISPDGLTITGDGPNGWVVHLACVVGPTISMQPASASACSSGSRPMSIATNGTVLLAYQWQVQTAPNTWQSLANHPAPLPCGGSATAYATPINSPNVTIGIRPCPGSPTAPQHFQVRCLVSNACGSVTSNEATYTICPADFNCSGSLTINDIFDFLSAWFAGNPSADFNGIGGDTVQDIFDFLAAWFAGC